MDLTTGYNCDTVPQLHRSQTPIKDVLLELEEISEDSKIKREVKCLATYELKDFEFILDVII